MAHSVPEPAPLPAAAAGFAAEFERLAGRPPTEAETEVARRASSADEKHRATWAEGLFPEALAHVAVSLASAEGLRILFISPSADLLEHRQLRLKNRAPTSTLTSLSKETDKTAGIAVWASPTEANAAHVARAFGSKGPDVILIEDAHASVSESFVYRPSLAALSEVIERCGQARVICGAVAGGPERRNLVAKALGLAALKGKRGAAHAVYESIVSPQGGPVLRVEKEESDAIAAIIGPLPRPCVVLCSTPAQADQVYAHLEAEQVPVHRYHGGLPASTRARELVHFALPGRRAVMVAVSAFGPSSGFAGKSEAVPEEFGHGYARGDLRSLVHLCAPCSLDQYAQELALLGAKPHPDDGEAEAAPEPPGVALMLYNPAHLALNLALLQRKRPTPDALGAAVEGLLRAQKGQYLQIADLDPSGGTSPRSMRLALDFLADLRVIERKGSEVRAAVGVRALEAAKKSLEEDFERLSSGDGPRLEEVERYALSESCRALTLQKLLGRQEAEEACGTCDVCAPDGLSSLSEPGRGHAINAPTIETRPMKRRAPARQVSDADVEEDFGEFESELDALEA